jgi:hypothetical protein
MNNPSGNIPEIDACIAKAHDRYRVKYPDNVERHLSGPKLSTSEYIKAKNVELGLSVAAKKKIYLDTKYWIYCLDALSGRPQKPIHSEIAKKLVDMVEAGDAVCPAHYATFSELAKVGDASRRRQLAKLVDWLSCKITIAPPEEQQQAELLYLLRSFSARAEDLHPVANLIWRPISFFLGIPIPSMPGMTEAVKIAMEKDWYDFFSNFGLEDFFVIMNHTRPQLPPIEENLHHRMNEGARSHRHEYNTFDQVFLNEVCGGLDALRSTIAGAFRQLFEAAGGTMTDEELREAESGDGVLKFRTLVVEAYKRKKLSIQWPSLHILSGIHAAIRYEQRQYKQGDMWDHRHAIAALPYCDMFLTERVLGTLITGRLLHFDKEYGCKVLWQDEDVLSALTGRDHY